MRAHNIQIHCLLPQFSPLEDKNVDRKIWGFTVVSLSDMQWDWRDLVFLGCSPCLSIVGGCLSLLLYGYLFSSINLLKKKREKNTKTC